MRGVTGLDNRVCSPLSRDKIITTAAETKSYTRAAMILKSLAEIKISSRHINRMTDKVGSELRQRTSAANNSRNALNFMPLEI